MSSKAESARIQAEIAARLGHVIKRAEQALIAQKSAVLRPFDLTVPQYATLMTLSYSPGSSGAQLARACMVTPQTMATVLGNLETKGLIRRDPSSVHKKVLVTELTRSGRTVLADADAAARTVEDRLAAEFDREDREQLLSLLERAIKVLAAEG
jgi:DNA-binding MarR family transcriptional regulator